MRQNIIILNQINPLLTISYSVISKINLFNVRFIQLFLGICFVFSCKDSRQPVNSHDHCATSFLVDTTSIRSELAIFASLMTNQSGAFVLEDGDGSMIARAWLTSHAQKTIDIQYFIFSIDNVGLIACDYLVNAADRGVKVRILVDDIMVEAEPEDILILDAHPNIDIKIYNPGANVGKNIWQKVSKIVTDFRGINQRMHNKVFIADGATVITGGRNIADEYFDYDHEYNFRDRDIFLIGNICQPIKTSFEDFWTFQGSVPVKNLFESTDYVDYHPKMFEKLHQYACDTSNYWPQVRKRVYNIPNAFKDITASGDLIWTDSIIFVTDKPGKNDGSKGLNGGGLSTDAMIKLIENATSSIDIQSPYLVTTNESRKLISDAVRRGVKVRILTNSLASTDNLEAFSGYQRDRQKLLATGVRIFEFRPDAACRFEIMTGVLQKSLEFTPTFGLHAKSMIIDGHITVIGTFNLDPRSTNLNTECVTIIHNTKLAKQVQKGFDIEFLPANAWETTKDWNPDNKVSIKKQASTFIRKVVPKSVL